MVNGIENPIMINRTAEYARQTADRVNQAENAKAFAAQIEKEKVARESQMVGEMEHSENKVVRRNRDNDSEKREGSHPESRDGRSAEDESQTVGPSEILGKEIDIII